MTAVDARAKLATLSIPLTEESFFQYLKAGDREVTELFLDAGTSPDLIDLDRTAAVAVAMNAGQKDLARLLLARGCSPEPLLVRPIARKDRWDKLTAASGLLSFLSGILIAAVGGYFTYSYNRSQAEHDSSAKDQANKVVELDAVQKLIPVLTSKDEQSKAAALTAIHDLAHAQLATDFAILFKGQGSIEYLQQAAATSGAQKESAIKALSTIATTGTKADSDLATSALFSVNGVKVKVSINVPETVNRAEAERAEQELKSNGFNVTEIDVKRVDESPHETTVRFFQYDRDTVAIGKKLVQLLKDIGFNVRTEYDDEYVGNPSGPAPGTYEFWIGTTPRYNPGR